MKNTVHQSPVWIQGCQVPQTTITPCIKILSHTCQSTNSLCWKCNVAPGFPKHFSSCSLFMTISSLGDFRYELCKFTQYLVGESNETSNFLNINGIRKRGEKKTRFHTAPSVIFTFQTTSKITQIYKCSCQPTHIALEADNLDMFVTKTNGTVHGISGCSLPNLHRSQLRCAQ